MCGRYSQHHSVDEIVKQFGVQFITGDRIAEETGRYNIAPTQQVPVIVENGGRFLDTMRWGLVPGWAKDLKVGNKMINAQAERVAISPAFKTSLARRRCLIPADGFYEWLSGTKKQPIYFRRRDHGLFAFAGLWDTWRSPEGEEIRSCTVITTEPNELVAPVHNRMPVILDGATADAWLDTGGTPAATAQTLLGPYDASLMESLPVSTRVGSPREQGADLIERIAL